MAFFGFGKGKSSGSKKPAAKNKKQSKNKKKQRLVSIKNLHLNPTIEDSLYKTLAEGISNPDEPYISIATIDGEQFIYELALTDELIHQNGFDKGEPNIISQIKTGLALTGKHGNDVPKGLVNGSFFFDLDPEEGTDAQIVFVPTVGTLRRLEDLGGEDAKYQLVIIPADIDADNYDEYYQDGLINSPLQDDDSSENRLVTIDEFKSLAEEGAGSPDLQENEGVDEELDEDAYIAPPSEQAPDSGNDLPPDTGSDDLHPDDLTGGDDLALASDNLTGGDDLSPVAPASNDDDLTLDTDDDLDLVGNEDLSPTTPAKNDPLASNDDDLTLDTDDNLDLVGNEDGDDGLDGFLSDEDNEEGDEFVGYDGKADQGPTVNDELSSNQGGLTVANDDEPEEVADEDEPKEVADEDEPKEVLDEDDKLDELDDDDSESTDDMFDSLTDNDDNWDENELPIEDEQVETTSDKDEGETDNKPVETDSDKDEGETDNKPVETDSDEDEGKTDNKPVETDSDEDEGKTDNKPVEAAKSKEKKSSDGDGDGDGDGETKPTAKDLGYVDINKQNLDSFIRQNIIQLDNALDGLDARLFPIDAKHDDQAMIGYKTMYNSLLESQAKREKELIRTKFKHQLAQLLDPYVNHSTFSDNFPKINTAFQEKLFNPEDIDAEKATEQERIEDRYKKLHQRLIDDAIAKAEDDYANNYEPVKEQELEEASKVIDVSRRQKYDQAVDRVLNKAFYLNEAELSKEAQKITSQFITNDVAEANIELTNKIISYSEEMMRYMQFDKMIDARVGSTQKADTSVTQKVDDSVMRQTIEELQDRLRRQMEENKNHEKKIAALQSEINKAKTEPKPVKPPEPVKTPEPVLDGGDEKVQAVVHDELKTGNELLAEIKRAMVKNGRKKPVEEIIKTAELDDEPVKAPEK